MLPDYVAYLAAQRCAENAARNARPHAPVLSADQALAPGLRLVGFRARLGADLHRLADRLDPTTRRYAPAPAHRR